MREVLQGLTGGAAFLVGLLVLGMPPLLAALAGVAVYFGLGLALGPRLSAPDRQAAPGLSTAERDAFVQQCRKSVEELQSLSAQVAKGPFAAKVRDLALTAGRLVQYLEKKPEGIVMAFSIPRNLDHLAGMLRQYVAISAFQESGETTAQALEKVEDIFTRAHDGLAGMYQQLLHHDVAALENAARTLDILMGTEAALSASNLGPNATLR